MNMEEPAKRMIDNAATGGWALTTIAYYSDLITPILTCGVLLITFAWYVMRFIDRARGKSPTDE